MSGYPRIPCESQDPRIQRVCHALRMQLSLNLKQLTQMVGLSASRLQHLFKEETGFSVREYKREARLQQARYLLAETHRPIKEICSEVGIPDKPNFVRYFKNRFGVTPAAYRRSAPKSA